MIKYEASIHENAESVNRENLVYVIRASVFDQMHMGSDSMQYVLLHAGLATLNGESAVDTL